MPYGSFVDVSMLFLGSAYLPRYLVELIGEKELVGGYVFSSFSFPLPLPIHPCSFVSVATVLITVAVWACDVGGLPVTQVIGDASNVVVPGLSAGGTARRASVHGAKRLGAKFFLRFVVSGRQAICICEMV